MPKKKITQRFVILILLFLSLRAQVYAANCSAVSVSPPVFPSVTSGSGLQEPVAVPLTFSCSPNNSDSVTIGIDGGLHYASTRNLQLAGINIPYTITNGVTPWGDGTLGLGNAFPTTANGSPQQATFTVTVKGNIPSGEYTDQLTITLNDGATKPSTTLNLTFTVLNSCTISSAPTPVNFGTVPAGATSVSSQSATIGMTCTNTAPYYWGADKGLNWLASRRMKAANSDTYIAYDLKENNSPLGDEGMEKYGGSNTTNISFRGPITGSGSQQTYDITATITTIPIPSVADSYSDTVSYTVAW